MESGRVRSRCVIKTVRRNIFKPVCLHDWSETCIACCGWSPRARKKTSAQQTIRLPTSLPTYHVTAGCLNHYKQNFFSVFLVHECNHSRDTSGRYYTICKYLSGVKQLTDRQISIARDINMNKSSAVAETAAQCCTRRTVKRRGGSVFWKNSEISARSRSWIVTR